MRTEKVLSFCLREAFSAPRLERRPEPAAMTDCESVDAFHAEGSATGGLLAVYHLNARAVSRLLPHAGEVVDLGSGSARYLMYLARCRPDIRMTGLDLSEEMVRLGARAIQAADLAGRVSLELGDMTDFSAGAPERVDMISSVFALHHLASRDDLRRSLEEIARVRRRTGCGVWIFDHSRPRNPRTAEDLSGLFTPDASPAFHRDSRNSLAAAWSFDELTKAIDEAGIGAFHHVRSSLLMPWQAHWLEPIGWSAGNPEPVWRGEPLPPRAARDFMGLRLVLWRVPLGR